MGIIYCRQPGGYYNNATVSVPDGTELNPYNRTWAQIKADLIAGNSVRLHPSYLIDTLALFASANGITTGSMICPSDYSGVLERWDVPGWDWIYPAFTSLDDIPSGWWVDVGSGNWECTFDGGSGRTNRSYGSNITRTWWGYQRGKNDVRKGQTYAGCGRELATVPELAVPGEFCTTNAAGKLRITVKTGGVNPTAMWGSFSVHCNNGPGSLNMTWNEVKYLTLRKLAFFGGAIAMWPAGNRQNADIRGEDTYHLMSANQALFMYPYDSPGSASGVSTNAAGYAIGATVITLDGAGTGSFQTATDYTDAISFAGDPNVYHITAATGRTQVTLAAPGLLQAIPASAVAVTVRTLGTNVRQTWKRLTADSGWPVVGMEINNTLPQESGLHSAVKIFTNAKDITLYDLRTRAWSHSAVEAVQQTARNEEGDDGVKRIQIIPTRYDDPGDGYGAYNTVDCGPVDYMRAIIMNCRDWYVGPVNIVNQSQASQFCGSGIWSAVQVPGSSRPYSEGTLANSNYNCSNGTNLQSAVIGGTLKCEAVEYVGAVLDATGNCAAMWTYSPPNMDFGCIRLRGCMVYDPGQAKLRPNTTPPTNTIDYPNTPIWAADNQSGDPYIAPLLYDNTIVKLAGGDNILSCHNTGANPNLSGGGMTSYTAAQVNAKDGTTDTGGLWKARGNAKYDSLSAAKFNSAGQFTGKRYVRRQRGSSSRGY